MCATLYLIAAIIQVTGETVVARLIQFCTFLFRRMHSALMKPVNRVVAVAFRVSGSLRNLRIYFGPNIHNQFLFDVEK
jgi:hypothetical protein